MQTKNMVKVIMAGMAAFVLLGRSAAEEAAASGGRETAVVQDGTHYRVHTFLSSGTLLVETGGEVEYLVVGGGGAGGSGGGGAGGFRTGTLKVKPGEIQVAVGAGGAKPAQETWYWKHGGNGGASSFGPVVAAGGGFGGGIWNQDQKYAAGAGGSGGGGVQEYAPGKGNVPATDPPQGHDGGAGNEQATPWPHGGGGGAGTPGERGEKYKNGGKGGDGLASAIGGMSRFYAGGGGGGLNHDPAWYKPRGGLGGKGGGGKGGDIKENGADGEANTGGGGGGRYHNNQAGAGGSGIVIVRYKVPAEGNPPTATGAAATSTFVVDQKNPRADDAGPGTAGQPFKTISAAAAKAGPGDRVLVKAGVYRERVAPACGGEEGKPVVYEAEPGGQVFIRGSEVFAPTWETLKIEGKALHQAALPPEWFQGRRNPYKTFLGPHQFVKEYDPPGRGKLTLGQVFVDGDPYREVVTQEELLAEPGRWMAQAGGQSIAVHFDGDGPGKRMVEVSVRDRIFAPHKRGLGYITVRGFVMEHCANQFPDWFWHPGFGDPQAGALGCRSGHHWIIEYNTIRFIKSVGIDFGGEGPRDLEKQPAPHQKTAKIGEGHVIRKNVVSDCGTCGIAGAGSFVVRIVGNVVERNGQASNGAKNGGAERSGIKVHHFSDGVIEGNWVEDNVGGVWLDNGYTGARVSRNVCLRGAYGIFCEMGTGPVLIDNNVIGLSVKTDQDSGSGMYSHDASGITFAHNLVFGCATWGAFHQRYTDRVPGAIRNIALRNNIFAENKGGAINLLHPAPKAENNTSDFNIFLNTGTLVANNMGWPDFKPEKLFETVRKSLKAEPMPYAWPHWIVLTFSQWQQVMNCDAHSVYRETGGCEFGETGLLTLKIDEQTLTQARTEPIPNLETAQDGRPIGTVGGFTYRILAPKVETDFFGELIPKTGAFPGPIQKLKAGSNVFQLARPIAGAAAPRASVPLAADGESPTSTGGAAPVTEEDSGGALKPASPRKGQRQIKLTFIGDSNMIVWPDMTRDLLANRVPNVARHEIIGRPGKAADWILHEIREGKLKLEPDEGTLHLAVVMLGTNNYLVPELQKLVGILEDRGYKVVVLTAPPRRNKEDDANGGNPKTNKQYNDELRKLYKPYEAGRIMDVQLVDIVPPLLDPDKPATDAEWFSPKLSRDPVHFQWLGYEVMRDHVGGALEEMLR